MARTKAEIISEMVDSGLFTDDEIRNAVKQSQGMSAPEVSSSPSMAAQAASIVTPTPSAQPPSTLGGWISRIGRAAKETAMAPIAPWLALSKNKGLQDIGNRAISPALGQVGVSQLAQEIGDAGRESIRNAGQNTAEKIATSPLANVSPNLAAGLGAAVGTATDAGLAMSNLTPMDMASQVASAGVPIAAREIVDKLSPAGKLVGKGMTKFSEWMTGVKSHKFEKVISDPSGILPEFLGGAQSLDKAAANYSDAINGMSISRKINPLPNYHGTIQTTWEKLTSPENLQALGVSASDLEKPETIKTLVKSLSPQEAFDNYSALNQVMNSAVSGKDKVTFRAQTIYKNALKERLSEASSEFGPKLKEMARTLNRSDVTSILPRNKYGTPSIGRAGFAATVAGPAGYAMGGPIGATIATMIGTSPLMHSLGYAAVSGAGQAANKIVNSPAFIPAASTGFRAIINRAREKK